MKRVLAIFLVLIILVVAAALIIPAFIPLDIYKERISAAVKEQTGRELVIGGDISLSIFPNLGLKMENVTFSNFPGSKNPYMASMKELIASVGLRPLLHGEFAINTFILREPEIHLEIAADGTANWQLTGPGEDMPPEAAPEEGFELNEVRLQGVRIVDGRASYVDARTAKNFTADDIDLSLSLPGLDETFKADGGLNWNGERIDIDLAIAEPRGLLERGNSAVDMALRSALLVVDFNGSIAALSPLAAKGTAKLDVPSLYKLLVWVGSPPADRSGPKHLTLAGLLDVQGDVYSFENTELTLDNMKGRGRLSANMGGTIPRANGQLAFDMLDLDALSGETEQAAAAKGAPPSTEWSSEPIDFSGLKTINGNFNLTAGKILTSGLAIGRSALNIGLENGVMTAALKEMALYGGNGTGTLHIDARQTRPQIGADFKLNKLEVLPFFTDAADFKRLRGTGDLDLNLAMHGRSQKEMMENLSGNGSLLFSNGAIVGIDIAGTVRDALSIIVQGWKKGERRDTDFSKLSGTFTITNGILTNKDLQLIGPLVRLTGDGEINVARKTVNYVLEPKFVASLKGQGGATDMAGIRVPIRVTGSWFDPKFAPDLGRMLKDPGAILESAKKLKDNINEKGIEGALGGLLGRKESTPSAENTEEKPAQKNPQDVLKNIFGGQR